MTHSSGIFTFPHTGKYFNSTSMWWLSRWLNRTWGSNYNIHQIVASTLQTYKKYNWNMDRWWLGNFFLDGLN